MSAETRPVITSLARTTWNSEPVYESKPEVISQASTIPELISYLKAAFRERDFSLVEKILLGREKQLRTEIQNLKRDFDLAEKAHALVELDKLNMEDQLNIFQRKCEVLTKEKAEAEEKVKAYEEKIKELDDRMSVMEEEMAKKRDEDVSVIQKMAEDWEAAKEEVVEQGSGNTDFVSARTNMDNCPDAQALHPMPSACGSARVNSNLSNLGKKRCRSEEADLLPTILACENRAPIVDLSACEAGDSSKFNVIIDSLSDSDDDDLTDKSMEILLKRIKDKRFFSEDGLRSSFEKDPELCMKGICALYRQHISPDISSKGLSFTKSQGFSQSDKISFTLVLTRLNLKGTFTAAFI